MTRTPSIPTSSLPHRGGRIRASARLVTLAAAAVCLAVLATGCGKKGSPLPPLVKTPAVPADLTVRKAGDTVYVRFTVPTINTDRTGPADLRSVEVYAYTADHEVEGMDYKDMTLVGEVLVAKPVDPAEAKEERENPEKAKRAAAKPRPVEPGVEQGTTVTVTEALTPETMQPTKLRRELRPPPIVPHEPSRWTTPLDLPMTGPVPQVQRVRRFYLVYSVNHRGVRGTPSPRFAVPFDVVPPPPGQPRLALKSTGLEVSWAVPDGAPRWINSPILVPVPVWPPFFLLFPPPAPPAPPAPPPPPGTVVVPATAAATPAVEVPEFESGKLAPLLSAPRGSLLPVLPLYNVYRVRRDQQPSAPDGAPVESPLPLNDKPLTDPVFVDIKLEYGQEYCYQVRTVNTAGTSAMVFPVGAPIAAATGPVRATPAVVESLPSPVACIVPEDTEPPPAPTALAAVSSAGAISLIWNAVDAADLAGYIVLRGQGAPGAMTPLFTTPITETTYRDTTVAPGVRYVYEVVAVDKATPPNRSPASNRVEETAR